MGVHDRVALVSVSIVSMVAIENVSDANAIGSDRRSPMPERRSGSMVSE
jgi:hypothetical protein